MKEVFEKIIERLETEVEYQNTKADKAKCTCAFEEISVAKAREKMAECYEHAIEIVNQVAEEYQSTMGQVKSETSESNDGWIPVSERLPEERDWYLAVFQEPDTGFIGLPYIADYLLGQHTNYTTNEGWIIKDCTDHEDACEYYKDLLCIAWQPLPAPYKPKGEK